MYIYIYKSLCLFINCVINPEGRNSTPLFFVHTCKIILLICVENFLEYPFHIQFSTQPNHSLCSSCAHDIINPITNYSIPRKTISHTIAPPPLPKYMFKLCIKNYNISTLSIYDPHHYPHHSLHQLSFPLQFPFEPPPQSTVKMCICQHSIL